jgi:hypothetical protein
VLCLVVGMLGATAAADDTTPPSAGSSTAPASASDPSSPDQSGNQQSSPDLLGSAASAFDGPPTVRSYSFTMVPGLTDSVNLGAQGAVDCHGNPCRFGDDEVIPPGWGRNVDPDTGVITIWVPGGTAPGDYKVGYTVTELNSGGNPSSLPVRGVVDVPVTPDSFNPPAGMLFSHPYRKGYRNIIRNQILRAINSTPSGATIQAASWSFSSKTYRKALAAARARGVTVELVLAWRNKPTNSDYGRLARTFGTSVSPGASWVKKCWHSCRGVGGTMHAKIFLFTQVYRTPFVMMSGSANLTDFAVTNQWNQMNTVTGDQAVYDEAVGVFTQMYQDRPAPYVETHYPTMTSYYYPRGRVSKANDFMLKALAPVRCTGAVGAARHGRTIVRIAMYAWYQSRGKWLAKRVRQLWQQGCQVQIVYAISSNPVKSILYSPAGRGRIPMRQILLTNTKGTPIYYLHDKWVAITGNYAGVANNSVSFHGSFNFSDLGFSSDEQFQMLRGRAVYDRFARDFKLLWTDRQARAPSPVSKIPTIEGRYSDNDLRLGRGVYRYMDAD